MANYKRGFAGVASQNYFSKVHDTIQSAENALSSGQNALNETSRNNQSHQQTLANCRSLLSSTSSNGDMTRSKVAPEQPKDQNVNTYDPTNFYNDFVPGTYLNQYEKAVDNLYNGYSQNAVVSNDNLYAYIQNSYHQYDEEMTHKISHAILEIENLLTNHLQVPTATPKIEAILEEIKQSLPQSSYLSQSTSNTMGKFSTTLANIDEGTGFELTNNRGSSQGLVDVGGSGSSGISFDKN